MTKLRDKVFEECRRHRPACDNGETKCFMYTHKSALCIDKNYEKLKQFINTECVKRPSCVNGCDICPVYESLICLEVTE